MRAPPVLLVILLVLMRGMTANAATFPSARSALNLLPEGAPSLLARVEGQEGRPVPNRWHFIVYDPGAENGFREYVVANGQLIVGRELSQFVERITPRDVIGSRGIVVDSDVAGEAARKYAAANGRVVAWMNYELRKNPSDGKGVWIIHCIDEGGAEFGRLQITSGKGTILSHDGLPLEPAETASTGGQGMMPDARTLSAPGSASPIGAPPPIAAPPSAVSSDEQFLRSTESRTYVAPAVQEPPPAPTPTPPKGGFHRTRRAPPVQPVEDRPSREYYAPADPGGRWRVDVSRSGFADQNDDSVIRYQRQSDDSVIRYQRQSEDPMTRYQRMDDNDRTVFRSKAVRKDRRAREPSHHSSASPIQRFFHEVLQF